MAEQTTGATPDTASEKPAGAVESDDDEGTDGETPLPDNVRRLIEKLRAESKAGKVAEREREALKKKLQDKDDAELSETERLRKQVEDLKVERQREAQERQVMRDDQAIYEAAVAEHAVKPKIIARLIERDAIEHDAAGLPTNIETLVKALLKAEPYLKGEAGPQGVPGTPRSTGQPAHEDRVRENQTKLQQTGQYGRL